MIDTADAALWQRVLIIANPAAHSGAAAGVAERLRRFLTLALGGTATIYVATTAYPRHAVKLAREATGCTLVVALGGDGVIHEVVSGLMEQPRATRPALAVAPVGSGNDYARTLGLPPDAGDSFAYLMAATPRTLDVGRIEVIEPARGHEDVPRVEHYVETLSVGIDAAIALGTQSIRERTPLTGDALYVASCLNQFCRHFHTFDMDIAWDDEVPRRISSYIMAVQIGPTYGSGFRVCPEADPADGLLDVCYAEAPVPRAVALALLARARTGEHVGSRHVTLRRIRTATFTFDGDDYPIQADGERIWARRLAVAVVPGAIQVLSASRR